eukprot:765335-Hanusia_phi.AAC.4
MTTRAEEEILSLSLRNLRQTLWPKLPPASSMKEVMGRGQDSHLLSLSNSLNNYQLQQLFVLLEETVDNSSRLIGSLRVDRLQLVELQERSTSLQALNDELTQAIDRLQNDFLVLLNAFQEKDMELKRLRTVSEQEPKSELGRAGVKDDQEQPEDSNLQKVPNVGTGDERATRAQSDLEQPVSSPPRLLTRVPEGVREPASCSPSPSPQAYELHFVSREQRLKLETKASFPFTEKLCILKHNEKDYLVKSAYCNGEHITKLYVPRALLELNSQAKECIGCDQNTTLTISCTKSSVVVSGPRNFAHMEANRHVLYSNYEALGFDVIFGFFSRHLNKNEILLQVKKKVTGETTESLDRRKSPKSATPPQSPTNRRFVGSVNPDASRRSMEVPTSLLLLVFDLVEEQGKEEVKSWT